jgi:hypothetical protein
MPETTTAPTTHHQSIKIGFGPLVTGIAAQLDSQGFKYKKENVESYESCRQALLTLNFAGMLTDTQYDKLREKLYNKIVRHICSVNKLTGKK